jgi:hypothetical protein
MADAHAEAKAAVKASSEAKAKAVEESTKNMGKPTPTQEENDLAKLGVPIETHEDDGSGPQPEYRLVKSVEPAPKQGGAGYQTRAAAPAKPAAS